MASIDCAKTTARQHERHLTFLIGAYIRDLAIGRASDLLSSAMHGFLFDGTSNCAMSWRLVWRIVTGTWVNFKYEQTWPHTLVIINGTKPADGELRLGAMVAMDIVLAIPDPICAQELQVLHQTLPHWNPMWFLTYTLNSASARNWHY